VAWRIRGDAEPAPWEDKDARGWIWTIERDDEVRFVRVELTGQAEIDPREEVREAAETNGRSALDTVLDDDDPPARITFTSGGREDFPYRQDDAQSS
jgi:hypothetical protein